MTEEGRPCSRHHTSALSADWTGGRGRVSGDMKQVVPAPETCGQPSCILSEALGQEWEGASESEAQVQGLVVPFSTLWAFGAGSLSQFPVSQGGACL